MPEFEVGDLVQDVCWDGAYAGTVLGPGSNGTVRVRWDGRLSEDEMSPSQIVRLERAGGVR